MMVEIRLQDGAELRVDVVGEAAFRVRTARNRSFDESPMVRYGLVQWPDDVPAPEVSEEAGRTTIRAAAATLVVEHQDGTLTLAGADGAVRTSSRGGISGGKDGVDVAFHLDQDERLFGLGDVSRDRIQRRGQRVDTWVRNVTSYMPIPFVMSSRGWGLFVNSTRRQVFDLGATDTDALRVTSRDPEVDLVLFAGAGLPAVLNAYTRIIGRPTLLPQWAYGLTFVCHYQADARTMLDDASRMREHDIPCDVIGLEPGWMQKMDDFSTEKRWDPDRFHIPEWMMNTPQAYGDGKAHTFFGALDRLGYKLSLWLCSEYDLSYEAERQAVARGFEPRELTAAGRFGGTPDLDDSEQDPRLQWPILQDEITKPDEPWFEHLKKFVDQGASAFKLDGANQVLEHPDRLYGNGMHDDEMHNLYPALLSQQMHEGFVAHTGRRPLVYGSGGYAGIARHAATWAGDTGGGPKPLASMLNHGLSGHSNTSCDMLVFSPEGIHFGFLQAWSQVCSWAYWRHPWLLGEPLEQVFRDYAKLRYRLLPYIYSTAYVASQTGLPMLRAMPLAYPDYTAAEGSTTQYLLGDFLLVGAFTNEIHLPPGEWTDYWTGQRHTGPATISLDVPENRGGPLLVKAGAILPSWPEMNYVGHRSVERIGLDVYPGPATTFTLYEDDGETVEHESGAFALTVISAEVEGDRLTVDIAPRSGHYAGMPEQRHYDIAVHTPRAVRAVTVNGTPTDVDASVAGLVRVSVSEDPDRSAPKLIVVDLAPAS